MGNIITEEDYVSFKTAKLLKEKGFDEECECLYADGKMIIARGGRYNWNKGETLSANYKNECSAPTLQMAKRWLRKVHHYYIQIMLDGWSNGGHSGYYVLIQKTVQSLKCICQIK